MPEMEFPVQELGLSYADTSTAPLPGQQIPGK